MKIASMKTWMVRCVALVVSVFAFTGANAATEWSTQDYDLYPGDFNGDGKTDLLYIAEDASKVSGIVRSDGSAPNIPSQSWSSSYLGIQWFGRLYTPIVADFNGDGRSDVFLQRTTPGDHYLLLADLDGNLSAIGQTVSNSLHGLTWSADQHKVHAGDFNGNGKADLFLQATSPSGTNYILLSDNFGKFITAPSQNWTDASWSAFKWSTKNSNIYVGNFDGDGDADLLVQAKPNIVLIDFEIPIPVPTYAPNSFGVAFSAGVSLFSGSVQQWNRNSHGVDWTPNSTNLAVGDFDGDGRSDVILQARNASRSSFRLSGQSSGYVLGSPASLVATTLANNVTWSADSTRLVVGNFDGTPGAGVYFQATSSGGNNTYANTVTGGSVSTTTHTSGSPSPTTAVGRTAGSAGVTPTGTATYSIPIWTPPGTNGVAPSIGLGYASRDVSNGWLGVGWGVGATSAIVRCPSSYAQDGDSAVSMFATDGRLCLDGSRLRLESGTYGAAGSGYRTEIETYRQIKIIDADANGPKTFEVRTPDGRRMYYGMAGGSSNAVTRLSNEANVLSDVRLSWSLNRVEDLNGNYMEFEYSQDAASGGFYLKEIRWTGKAGASASTPYYKAVFTNEARPDPVSAIYHPWVNGEYLTMHINLGQRLARIDIQTMDGSLLRSYRMGYATTTGTAPSRLESVQECGLGGAACLAPTTFTWLVPSPSPSVTTTYLGNPTGGQPLVADINGDRRDDLLWATGIQPSNTWKYALSNGDGSFGTVQDTGKTGVTKVVDWNNDGKQDLVLYQNSAWHVLPGTTTGFGAQVSNVDPLTVGELADVNGDGQRDAIYSQGSGLYTRLRSDSTFGAPVRHGVNPSGSGGIVGSAVMGAPSKRRQDFDGDGYEDILYQLQVVNQMAQVGWVETGRAFGASSGLRGGGSISFETAYKGSGDFNGDGRTDVLLVEMVRDSYGDATEGNTIQIALSGSPTLAYASSTGPVCVLDWDADGKDDLLMRDGPANNLQWFFHRSMGNGAFAPATPDRVTWGSHAMCGDFDGDGFDDVASTSGGNVGVLRQNTSTNPQISQIRGPQLESVTDGFGVTTKFTYSTLDNTAVYADLADSPEPSSTDVVKSIGHYSVVKTLTTSDGTGAPGATYNLNYFYQGIYSNVRGPAGFAKRTISDSRSNVTVEESYRLAYPFAGALKERLVKVGGVTVSRTTNTWDKVEFNPQVSTLTRVLPYLNEQVTEQSQGGVPFARTTTKVNTISGSNGVVTDRTTTTTELGSTGLHSGASWIERTVLTDVVDVNTTDRWCLGLVGTVQQTSSHTASVPAGAAITRKQTNAWNTSTCRIDSQSPDLPASMKVTTSYGYDAWGNVATVTQAPEAGQGQDARTTTINWGAYAGRFPRKVTNAEGHITTLEWDPSRAVQTRVKYPNSASPDDGSTEPTAVSNVVAQTFYDSFLRTSQAIDPSGAVTDIQYAWCNTACRLSDANRRLTATVVQRDKNGNETSRAISYLDQFNREILTQAQIATGAFTSVSRTFDTLGRLWRQSTPALPGDPVAYTTYEYDALGRATSVSSPASESNSTAATVTRTYTGLTVSSSAVGRNDLQIYNPLGQVMESREAGKSVFYDYNADGQLLTAADAAANASPHVTTLTYYPNGLKKTSTDPDMGVWSYEYYPLGELKKQTDANLKSVEFTYDKLSRVKTRTEDLDGDGGTPDVTQWFYDTATHGKGQLGSLTAPGGYQESYTYDTSGRLDTTTVTAAGAAYTFGQSYDDAGRLSTLTYPASVSGNPFKVRYDYGFDLVNKIIDATVGGSSATLWQATDMNARGQITDEQLGNNALRTRSTYDRIAGYLTARGAGTSSNPQQYQNFKYEYEANGNLEKRHELNLSLTETFGYDGLDRLKTATLATNGATTTTMSLDYDSGGLGNVISKTGMGTYGYAGGSTAGPHAVTSTNEGSYAYDDNGTMTSRAGYAIQNFTFNLPKTINGASASSTFAYGADRQRYRQDATYPDGATETTISIGGLFDVVTRQEAGQSANTEYRHAIVGPEGAVMQRTRRASGITQQDYYLSKDHLGSVTLVTNSQDAARLSLSYDAFGQRRNGANWSSTLTQAEITQIGRITRRGYTGHEHLDNLGLIHMNGRVQDPKLGRFLSADPFVQAPFNRQSFNRYSYVFNSPLNFTDPSGYQAAGDDCDFISAGGHNNRMYFTGGFAAGIPPDFVTPGVPLGMWGTDDMHDVRSWQAQQRYCQMKEQREANQQGGGSAGGGGDSGRSNAAALGMAAIQAYNVFEIEAFSDAQDWQRQRILALMKSIEGDNSVTMILLRAQLYRGLEQVEAAPINYLDFAGVLSITKLSTYLKFGGKVSSGTGRSLDDLSSLRGASVRDVEALADAKYLQQGWAKKPLSDGNGIRYFDGKGNSLQINQGYPAGGGVHGGPYVKTTQGSQIVRIPLEGNPAL